MEGFSLSLIKTATRTLSYSFLLALATAIGCSTKPKSNPNYFIAETSEALLFAYSGEAFLTAPEVRVYQLVSPLTLFTDFANSVQLSAYQDSSCQNEATGTLTLQSNPMPFSEGIADFDNASYTVAPPGLESLIYFSSVIPADGTHTCGVSHSIIQHFNKGVGSLHGGFPGASGNGTAATVADVGLVHRITSSGNYLIAGTSKNASNGTELALWQYLPNGSLDTSFNTTGYYSSGSSGVAGAGGASEQEIPADIQFDPSGNFFVVGSSKNAAGGSELAVWKIKSTGILDTSFGTGGTFHLGAGITGASGAAISDFPKAMQIDSFQNLVITGTSQNPSNGSEMFVVRMTSQGTLDPSFGNGGIYHSGNPGLAGASGSSENDVGNGIQIAHDGNYFIVGSSTYSGGGTELAIWKLSSSGQSLDSSFGGTGSVISGTTGAAQGTGAHLADVGKAVQLDSSGKLVITGSSQNASGGTEMAIWRYQSNGSLDTQFNSSGIVHSGSTSGAAGATGVNESDTGVNIGIDTRYNFYIVGGDSKNAAGGHQGALWRYNLDGSVDKTLALKGTATTLPTGAAGGQTAATVNDQVNYFLLDSFGTYILVGSTLNSSGGTELAVWRYLLSGTPDI